MKKSQNETQLLEVLQMERLIREANALLGNRHECMIIDRRIAEIKNKLSRY